jgi:hypothetical protein
MRAMRNVYRMMAEEREGNIIPGRSRRKCENNIKTNLKKISGRLFTE